MTCASSASIRARASSDDMGVVMLVVGGWPWIGTNHALCYYARVLVAACSFFKRTTRVYTLEVSRTHKAPPFQLTCRSEPSAGRACGGTVTDTDRAGITRSTLGTDRETDRTRDGSRSLAWRVWDTRAASLEPDSSGSLGCRPGLLPCLPRLATMTDCLPMTDFTSALPFAGDGNTEAVSVGLGRSGQ